MKSEESYLKNLENIITALDVGIDSLKIIKHTKGGNILSLFPKETRDYVDFETFKEEIPELNHELVAVHKVADENSEKIEYVEFPLERESAGTKNLFTLALTLLEYFDSGSVMIIDEFERSLHPHIPYKLVQLFHDPDINKNNAQLIFTTHAVNLLDNDLFRRDQVWFTEKTDNGITDLYSLSQVEGVRKDVPYDKWYLSGRFGATPVLYEPDIKIEDVQKGK